MNPLTDILTFAWRGSGKYIMATCVVLSLIADLAGLAPGIGGIASLLVSGYFCAVYYQMIQSTATGGKEAPDFPETSNVIEDLIRPMLQIVATAGLSFGPFIAYGILTNWEESNPLALFTLLGLGASYFPMAMLAVVVLGHLGALSPHIVLPAICRGGWIHWVGALLLLALYATGTIIHDLLHGHLVTRHLVMAVVGSYTLMTHARTLGVVYRERREELGWL